MNNKLSTTTKKVSANKKKVVLKILKPLIFIALFVVAYIFSYKISGFYQTNIKLLTLVISIVVGFLFFYLIYGVIYLISYVKIKRKEKRNSNLEVNCDDKVSAFFKGDKYRFKYNTSVSFTDNLIELGKISLEVNSAIAEIYGKGGKYSFLNYPVYDGLDFLGNALDVLHYKLYGVLSLLKLEDKPISFIEKNLNKVLYNEVSEEVAVTKEKKGFFTAVKDKVKSTFIKTSIVVMKGKIQSVFNECIEFVASESFRIYSKNGKTPTIKGDTLWTNF